MFNERSAINIQNPNQNKSPNWPLATKFAPNEMTEVSPPSCNNSDDIAHPQNCYQWEFSFPKTLIICKPLGSTNAQEESPTNNSSNLDIKMVRPQGLFILFF